MFILISVDGRMWLIPESQSMLVSLQLAEECERAARLIRDSIEKQSQDIRTTPANPPGDEESS